MGLCSCKGVCSCSTGFSYAVSIAVQKKVHLYDEILRYQRLHDTVAGGIMYGPYAEKGKIVSGRVVDMLFMHYSAGAWHVAFAYSTSAIMYGNWVFVWASKMFSNPRHVLFNKFRFPYSRYTIARRCDLDFYLWQFFNTWFFCPMDIYGKVPKPVLSNFRLQCRFEQVFGRLPQLNVIPGMGSASFLQG